MPAAQPSPSFPPQHQMRDALFHLHASQHSSGVTNYTAPSFGTPSLLSVAEPPNPAPILCLPPDPLRLKDFRTPFLNPPVRAGGGARKDHSQRRTHPGAEQPARSGPCWGSAGSGGLRLRCVTPLSASWLRPGPPPGRWRPPRRLPRMSQMLGLPPGATQRSIHPSTPQAGLLGPLHRPLWK